MIQKRAYLERKLKQVQMSVPFELSKATNEVGRDNPHRSSTRENIPGMKSGSIGS
jgi:hypothetical protein